MATDDINENLVAYADELSGRVNEHNFAEDMITDGADFDDDAVLTVNTLAQDMVAIPPSLEFQFSETWSEVAGTRHDFTTRGGTVWAMFSGQAMLAPPMSPFMFVIMLDGAILYESLLGGGDTSNDALENVVGVIAQGPGLAATFLPVVVEAVTDLTPGDHSISLAVRCLSPIRLGTPGIDGWESTVIEMW